MKRASNSFFYFVRMLTLSFVLGGGLVLSGCGTSSGEELPGNGDSAGDGDSGAKDGCYVHLYDGDDFDERDDNFRLEEPGRYSDLRSLPGSSRNWDDEADSLKVGPKASVTVWSERDFKGNKQEFKAGDEEPDLDDEPRSLELRCED